MLKKHAFIMAVMLAAICVTPSGARLHGGGVPAAVSPGGTIAPFTIYNTSGGTLAANTPITAEHAFQTGDVPTSNKIQILDSDGTTVLTSQEDGCSQWAQDSSRKACSISFLTPSSSAAASKTYYIKSVAGSPNTTPNVTKTNITANTNICLKSSDFKQAAGTAETGTWDLICLNTVLNNYAQYSGTTGYGANPVGGWEYYASGPNRVGVHAFQYAIRESDSAIHKWVRTDMWVDFWGSGSTPCPCSIATTSSLPNTFGQISGSTVGATTETAYVFSAQLLNGANVIYNFGGAGDARTIALTSSNFNTSNSVITLAGGNVWEYGSGTFPVSFSSTGTLPTGLTSGSIYWIRNTNGGTIDQWTIQPAQCTTSSCVPQVFPTTTSQVQEALPGNTLQVSNGAPNNTVYIKFCPTSTCVATSSDNAVLHGATTNLSTGGNGFMAYLSSGVEFYGVTLQALQTITTTGSGTITMTPLTGMAPFSGWMGLDQVGRRLWVNSGGTVMAAPEILRGHDFTYLTQRTKATLPYITALSGNLLAVSATGLPTYYPNSYYYPYDINSTGSGAGDNRIGYMDDWGAYTLFNPGDKNAQQRSSVLAAGFSYSHMYHYDETVGQPVVLNNGPSKSGTTYTTLGSVQPTRRTYPYNSGAWMSPSGSYYDQSALIDRYGVWMDPSHLPSPMQGPLLKTGHPEWQSQLVQEVNAVAGNMYFTSFDPGNGTTYYRVFGSAPLNTQNNQTRGVGWATRALGQANYFQPAGSPISQYLKDILKDNADFYPAQVPFLPSQVQALGYFSGDLVQRDYQFWMDDFLWLGLGMEAWRGEYSGFTNFTTTYLNKQVIGRMDATITGSCLWGSPQRVPTPYTDGNYVAGVWTNLATTWAQLYTATNLVQGGAGWTGGFPGGSTFTCPGSGLVTDGNPGGGGSYGSAGNAPTSLIMDAAGSAAIGSLLGVSNSTTIYNAIRAMQYSGTTTAPPGCVSCGTTPLSFTSSNQGAGNMSYPEWAFGPLGASQ